MDVSSWVKGHESIAYYLTTLILLWVSDVQHFSMLGIVGVEFHTLTECLPERWQCPFRAGGISGPLEQDQKMAGKKHKDFI